MEENVSGCFFLNTVYKECDIIISMRIGDGEEITWEWFFVFFCCVMATVQ